MPFITNQATYLIGSKALDAPDSTLQPNLQLLLDVSAATSLDNDTLSDSDQTIDKLVVDCTDDRLLSDEPALFDTPRLQLFFNHFF